MQIMVKSLQGDEYVVEVQDDQLVSQLKSIVSERANGLPVDRLKLVYRGRTMQDSNLLSEYDLKPDCKVHLILQKEYVNSASSSTFSKSPPNNVIKAEQIHDSSNASSRIESKCHPASPKHQSKFEIILRERLANHFTPRLVEKIMANLQQEIDADINSSSLDDLERLAKQKLNIKNE